MAEEEVYFGVICCPTPVKRLAKLSERMSYCDVQHFSDKLFENNIL